VEANKAKHSGKEPKKHYALEVIVSITLFLVFLLVIATGVLSYIRLDQIIQTVNKTIRPDQKLILVKEIYNDLSEAENSVKSYSLTRNKEDMDRFYTLIEATGDRFEKLKSMCSRSDPMFPYILTLDSVVIRKFMNLDRLLAIQDEFRVQQAMDQVMDRIREEKMPVLPPVSDTVVVSDTAVIGDTVKRGSFFSRIFRRKEEREIARTDMVLITTTQPPAVTYDEISEQVSMVQEEALTREKMLRQEEWNLLQQDRLLMEQIRKVLAKMESVEKETMSRRTRDTEQKAGEVKQIIVAFGISASVLLLLATLVIFRYVRKNILYQKALRRAKEEAEDLSKTKERFYANMSHEIRTPMNIISGFVNQLLSGKLDNEQRDQLGMVKKSSDHLLGILNDLLDLSKLQAGKLELVQTTFSIREIMEDMRRWFEPVAKEKNIQLSAWVGPGVPQLVTGDPVRLRQILFNLTGNAIKFTEKGQVSIKAFPKEITDDNALVVFEVNDTGIGISPEDLRKIFDEFEQGSGPKRLDSGGTGLGLAITRKLIELHRGSLKVESKVGEGSSFRISIPYLKATGDAAVIARPDTTGSEILNGLCVLIVDDEEYNLKLLQVILKRYGCVLLEARSGEDALRLLDAQQVDLVLMDLHLPGMSGDQTALEMRRATEEKGSAVPVIIISAAITSESVNEFRQMGIVDCVPKPFEEEQLIQSVLRTLSFYPRRQVAISGPEESREEDQESLPDEEDQPVYDLAPLMEASGGDKAFFREMVQLFITNTDHGLEEITDCLAHQEWAKAAEIVHRINSPCRHLKAEKLYRLLKEAEALLNEPDKYWMSADMILQAEQEFERIRKDLEASDELK
jgi:signal transduction histidine kinase/CheY-like chemotaxis protein/HPt (histidine-containing phosphotransfer) domain-containing protein